MDAETALSEYVRARFGESARIERIERLGKDGGAKAFGYGDVARVHLSGARVSDIVVHVARRGGFGHDSLADRAVEAFQPFETFNNLPGHVRAVDVGTIDAEGRMRSSGDVRDFFLVTCWARGEPYAHDLERIAETGVATDEDVARAERLGEHLVTIHRDKPTLDETAARELYVRRLRDLVGHHECIAGLVDSYDGHFEEGIPSRDTFRAIERWALDQRHRHKAFSARLCRVHGDYHPWNVLFDGSGFARRMTLLDRSRGEWGEAADDLAAMSINYLFFALRAGQADDGAFARLFHRFFGMYLDESGDQDVLAVMPPYFVFRALVVASPVWYPTLTGEVRRRLFQTIDRVMRCERFEVRDTRWLFEG